MSTPPDSAVVTDAAASIRIKPSVEIAKLAKRLHGRVERAIADFAMIEPTVHSLRAIGRHATCDELLTAHDLASAGPS